MEFIDTYEKILRAFPTSNFDIGVWRSYTAEFSPLLQEKMEMVSARYDFERDLRPVIEGALEQREKIKFVHNSFQTVTRDMGSQFAAAFGTTLEVDVILCLGLCVGAGHATSLGERATVVLGVEKIIELDWCDEDKMFALIAHELGHIWHASAGGVFEQQSTAREQDLFQLYSEGVAMLCEQKLCHNDQYYHQNKNGWLDWCNAHLPELKREYGRRVEAGESIQDFFGDWCQYQGHSDVGYYLGCQFVKSLLHKYDLLSMARLDNRTLEKEFFQFVEL